jgi:hypothetical protein
MLWSGPARACLMANPAAAPRDASMSASSEAFTPRGRTITEHRASAVRRRDTPPSSTAGRGP